jgi:hypothetical protein
MSIITLNNRGVKDATAIGSVTSLGNMIFIKKLTASSSATLSFVDGSSDVVLDDTYKEYVFTFKNIHPSNDNKDFSFQASIDSGSNYNVTTTNTLFHAFHYENDSGTPYVAYDTSRDLAQSTSFTVLIDSVGTDNDQNASGYLHLFNPSGTVGVKHFIANAVTNTQNDGAINCFAAGYFNTTSAIDAVQFKFSANNIDAGDICLYGIA